jgi:hypothetical protein
MLGSALGEALLSDLDAFEPNEPKPARPSRGPLVVAALAIAALVAGLALLVWQVWQWREEVREASDTLRAAMVTEAQLRAIVTERESPRPAEPAIARAVVDLIKIELPPLLAPITLLPADPPPPARPEPEPELVLRQTVPFPRIGSEGDGEIERAIGVLTAEWRKHMANAGCTLAVEGHTDTKGSDEANLLLSERRAAFVAKSLAKEFASARIATHGWGERRLLILTPDGTDELANRRVDVTLTCPMTAMAMSSAPR